jgi:hypothetical protein
MLLGGTMFATCKPNQSLSVALILFSGLPALGNAQVNEYGNPMKLAPRPTAAAITPADLQTRLYIFADDSMQGRQTGRAGNMKGTAYIARELQRLGLEPAGDNGTYFQGLPYSLRRYNQTSRLSVNGRALRWLDDFVPVPGNAPPKSFARAQVVFGGIAGDTTQQISAEQAAGKFVILLPAPGQGGGRRGGGARGGGGGARGNAPAPDRTAMICGAPGGGGGGGGGGRGGGGGAANRFADAAAVATVDLQNLQPAARAAINNPQVGSLTRGGGPGGAAQPPAVNLRITPEAAALLLGAPVEGMAPGTPGGTVEGNFDFVVQPVPEFGRNVVAIVRGRDPALRGQFVSIGAHNDHVGFTNAPVDHDSLRAAASARLAMQISGGELRALTQEQQAAIRVNLDSLRRLRPARRDSIRNGADDDGSGSMAMLEIAEALALAPQKPRRSVLFVWHTGEEGGLSGSAHYAQNPTVPIDSIVANINMDMIGRGRATDLPGGGDDYLAVVGSKCLSTELGDMVTSVNQRQQRPLRLDYRFDYFTDWPGYNSIYTRSDHYNYARRNIPIAFFFTGLHQDYHQVTDEPQYIDYPHYSRIVNYIRDLVTEVANRDRRPALIRTPTND